MRLRTVPRSVLFPPHPVTVAGTTPVTIPDMRHSVHLGSCCRVVTSQIDIIKQSVTSPQGLHCASPRSAARRPSALARRYSRPTTDRCAACECLTLHRMDGSVLATCIALRSALCVRLRGRRRATRCERGLRSVAHASGFPTPRSRVTIRSQAGREQDRLWRHGTGRPRGWHMAAARAATGIAMVVGDSRKAGPWQDLDGRPSVTGPRSFNIPLGRQAHGGARFGCP
jgi:hypothetical protein